MINTSATCSTAAVGARGASTIAIRDEWTTEKVAWISSGVNMWPYWTGVYRWLEASINAKQIEALVLLGPLFDVPFGGYLLKVCCSPDSLREAVSAEGNDCSSTCSGSMSSKIFSSRTLGASHSSPCSMTVALIGYVLVCHDFQPHCGMSIACLLFVHGRLPPS